MHLPGGPSAFLYCALFAIPDMDRDLNLSASGIIATMSFDTSTLVFLRFVENAELTKDSSKHPSAHYA